MVRRRSCAIDANRFYVARVWFKQGIEFGEIVRIRSPKRRKRCRKPDAQKRGCREAQADGGTQARAVAIRYMMARDRNCALDDSIAKACGKGGSWRLRGCEEAESRMRWDAID